MRVCEDLEEYGDGRGGVDATAGGQSRLGDSRDTSGKTRDQRSIGLEMTEVTRRRYDRNAPLYDLMQVLIERRHRRWREHLWRRVQGPRVLEVGVGTGRNLLYYPRGMAMIGVDLSPAMLQRAASRVRQMDRPDVELRVGDVQALEFPGETFDTAVATFVFCSVPDPVMGLRELRRVVRRGGQLLLLEHMRSPNRAAARLMDLANPLVVRLTGANINRETLRTLVEAGWVLDDTQDMDKIGIFKFIHAVNAG